MPNGTTAAVTEAARLDEIGFPEFTTKLLTDTFNALVSANMDQTDKYMELVANVAKPLAEFINDTQEDISGDALMRFLTAALPAAADSEEPTKVAVGATLTSDDAAALNAALELPADAGVAGGNQVAAAGELSTQSDVDVILDAVARRIAANRYDLLKEMVRQGILRLVVEDGLIETRLTFTTYGSTYHQKHVTDFERATSRKRSRGGTGPLINLFGSYAETARSTKVSIRTSKETDRDSSGSRVQIFGMVRINFRTDYLPLAA